MIFFYGVKMSSINSISCINRINGVIDWPEMHFGSTQITDRSGNSHRDYTFFIVNSARHTRQSKHTMKYFTICSSQWNCRRERRICLPETNQRKVSLFAKKRLLQNNLNYRRYIIEYIKYQERENWPRTIVLSCLLPTSFVRLNL